MDLCVYDHHYSNVCLKLQEEGPDALLNHQDISLVLGIPAEEIRQWAVCGFIPVQFDSAVPVMRWGDVVEWLACLV